MRGGVKKRCACRERFELSIAAEADIENGDAQASTAPCHLTFCLTEGAEFRV